jgi:uncharacterized protein (UPF0276 family)|uniref:Uncharacterized protein n=1 Tax=Fistulifera solaris TaxID=1519565 RepID=A0A0U2LCH5_FISSO|nr:hypothetical protein [Fistulifera solaris]ALG35798.1 hypothetical protein [Fistulifera solaris]
MSTKTILKPFFEPIEIIIKEFYLLILNLTPSYAVITRLIFMSILVSKIILVVPGSSLKIPVLYNAASLYLNEITEIWSEFKSFFYSLITYFQQNSALYQEKSLLVVENTMYKELLDSLKLENHTLNLELRTIQEANAQYKAENSLLLQELSRSKTINQFDNIIRIAGSIIGVANIFTNCLNLGTMFYNFIIPSKKLAEVSLSVQDKELLKDTHNYAMKSVESKILDQAANTKQYNIFDGAKSLFDISREGG